MSAGAGALENYVTGLVFCALAWVVREVAVLLARVEADETETKSQVFAGVAPFGWILDAILIGLVGLGSSMHAGQPWLDRLFPPAMLVAMLRILPGVLKGRFVQICHDRALLASVLAVAVALGSGSLATHVGAIVAALAGIAVPGLTKRLTRP